MKTKYTYPWTKSMNKLKREAKRNGWEQVTYWDDGFRSGYLKTKGRKWWHVVVTVYRDGGYRSVTRRFKPQAVRGAA